MFLFLDIQNVFDWSPAIRRDAADGSLSAHWNPEKKLKTSVILQEENLQVLSE